MGTFAGTNRKAVVTAAFSLAAVLGGCAVQPVAPDDVETCLRGEGLSAAREPGLGPPVEARVNFDTEPGLPDPTRSGFVTFYMSEAEARRALDSLPRDRVRRDQDVLYTPFAAEADNVRTRAESETLVESCVTDGQASESEADDSDRKKSKRRRR